MTFGARVAGLIVLVAFVALALSRVRSFKGLRSRELLWVGAAISGLIFSSILFDDQRFLLTMPVLVNAVLLAGFGVSLLGGRTPIVESFTRAAGEILSAEQVGYCRSVTKVWCWFFALNGLVSLWLALWGSVASWGLYTGGLAYILVGLLFAGEYAVRKIRFG